MGSSNGLPQSSAPSQVGLPSQAAPRPDTWRRQSREAPAAVKHPASVTPYGCIGVPKGLNVPPALNGSFADIPEPRDGFRSKRYRFAKHIQRTYPEASGAIQGSVDNQGLAGFRVRGRPDYVVVVALVVAVFSWSDFHGS